MNHLFTNKMAPYVSGDLETTGLKSQRYLTSKGLTAPNPSRALILEIGAVIDPDGITPIENLQTYRALIKRVDPSGDEYALNMNKKLLEEAMDTGVTEEEALSGLVEFCKLVPGRKEGEDKVSFAGKNFGTFDFGFLNEVMVTENLVKHRIMDPGSFYYPYFSKIPSLPDINKLILGSDYVAHTAVEDAKNVVLVSRFEFNLRLALIDCALTGKPVANEFRAFLEALRKG